MRRKRGFTLVELLVVIAIITMLLALLAVLIRGIMERARGARTHALIKILDGGCHEYKVATGFFPPKSPFSDSRCLHYYLGKELRVPAAVDKDGNAVGWRSMNPIVEFKGDMLDLASPADKLTPTAPSDARVVIDAWGQPIRYTPYPGTYNKTAVDIWSVGRDGKDATPDDQQDNYSNFQKEF